MPLPPPASPGIPLDEIDTPALVVDLDALEGNIARMAKAVGGGAVRLRPHAKSHKCAQIARAQIAAGAVGVCSQKVSEAEALVAGGVADVLVTNEIVGRQKTERLARLAREAKIGVLADDAGNVSELDAAARAGRVPTFSTSGPPGWVISTARMELGIAIFASEGKRDYRISLEWRPPCPFLPHRSESRSAKSTRPR